MKNNLCLAIAIAFILAACNSGGEQSAEQAATIDSASHDTAHHPAPATIEIAPVPEVPAGARVFFKNLKEGQKISSPFKVEMGVEGMQVDTANGIIKAASGHHHILIDIGDSLATGTVVPKDSTHLHFGNAQTSAEVKLTAGKHRLTLQFADGLHRSYGGRLATTVNVEVKK